MIFMYWTSKDIEVAPAASAWKNLYQNFAVFSDREVIPLLPHDIKDIYHLIRLPSAKSDLARLLLLREYGGLYIDAHIGPTSPAALLGTIDKIFEYNLILFGKGWAMVKPTDFDLMNGVLAARKGTPELDIVIDRVVGNIKDQWQKERSTPDYVHYSLFGVTGTYTLVQSYFDQIAPRPQIKAEFKDKVFVHYMKDNQQSGFEIAAYYNYRKPGGHWSEREKQERFFLDEA